MRLKGLIILDVACIGQTKQAYHYKIIVITLFLFVTITLQVVLQENLLKP